MRTARSRPRMWHHDYLHLRPLARDLRRHLAALGERAPTARVLDLGSGGSPYGAFLVPPGRRVVRVDVLPAARPDVVARAEALPFARGAFDLVLSTQVLGLVEDPYQMGREIGRVMRPGGWLCLSAPAAWPYDSATVEHRFGEPQFEHLLPGLVVREVRAQGGLLALPFALFNLSVREAVRSAEWRLGRAGRLLRGPAAAAFVLSNAAGRLLERLARRGPLSRFLGYLDRRLPMNFLVLAEKPPA